MNIDENLVIRDIIRDYQVLSEVIRGIIRDIMNVFNIFIFMQKNVKIKLKLS